MSLLTEEQIEQLVDLHATWRDDKSYTSSYFDYLKEWNEKQTGVQVKVNWDLAPKGSMSLDVIGKWRDKNDSWGGFNEVAFTNIPRPTKPHPHAEIIAKYAEVAARRCDPWVEFEWTSGEVGSEDWKVCHEVNTGFNYGRRYRHIGDKPDPMTARKGDDKPWNLNRDD